MTESSFTNNDNLSFDHLVLQPDEIDYVIYHDPCCDGFGSALASYVYFKKNNGMNKYGNKVEYYPTNYYNKPVPDVSNKNVLICDFSYKNEIMHSLLQKANKLIVLDHHKTAEEELNGGKRMVKVDGKMIEIEQKEIPHENKVFRMNHSGAYITWRFFFGNTPVPDLIKYIQDNDIWTKALPNTKDVSSYLFSLPLDFSVYEKLLEENSIQNIIPIGKALNELNNTYIKQALNSMHPKFVFIKDKYYFGIFCNSTVLKSDIGNQSFTVYPHANFSAIYTDCGIFSLRSTDDRSDVSEIASFYGGGGHRNASGLSMPQNMIGKCIDDYKLYNILENIYFQNVDEYNAVILNASHNKKHIGKYLLQQRTMETYNIDSQPEKRIIQECCSIDRIRNNYDNYRYCNLAIIWNYDGSKNKSWITITWNDKTILDKLIEKYSSYEDYIITKDKITFTVSGVYNS
jgi:oligoribonuclease NrnB/cAMP/cGMP phosphodiesterase (DHH superfamily)